MVRNQDTDNSVADLELFRAQLYLLLSRLLGAPPDLELINVVKNLYCDDSPIGEAISELKLQITLENLEKSVEEYNELFIGVTQGELIPFKSYYLTGFLNEKPLAELREHMDLLGIEKTEEIKEPDDHIAFLMVMMHGLIIGNFGKPLMLKDQNNFFDNHIDCWAPKFFDDLERANSARIYSPVGKIGKLFMKVEGEAFLIAA